MPRSIHLDELNRRVRTINDHRRRVIERTFPEGDQSAFAYDARDNVIEFRRIAKPGSMLADIVITAEWNEDWNKLEWIRDARGCQTDFTYDASGAGMGELATATRPAITGSSDNCTSGTRPVYTFTYDTYGLVATTTDPTGVVVANDYDGSGRLISTMLDPGGIAAETTFSNFTSRGDPQTTTDPRDYATSTTYDALRRPILVRRHNGNTSAGLVLATDTLYDEMGRVTRTRGAEEFNGTGVDNEDWLTEEVRTYTATGQVATITNGEGDVSRTCYDDLDRADRTVDGVGRARRTVFDAAGQALELQGWWSADVEDEECELASTLPLGQATRFLAQRGYTLNGQVDWVDDANNNRSNYIYDGFDRLSRLEFPSATLGDETANTSDYENYTYDANGNRLTRRLRSNDTINFGYDNLNRQTVKDIPGGTAADVYYAFDLAGRRLSARFVSTVGDGIVYGYDSAGRLGSETSYGRALTFGYDDASNRDRITHPDSSYWEQSHDAANRLDQISESGSTVVVDYGYDALARRNSLARAGSVNTAYAYDDASRLTDLNHDLASTADDQEFTFAYTNASQLSQRTASNDNYTWEAPEAETEYERNGLNQYTEVGAEEFEYDPRGNLIDDGVRSFCYDYENRLLAVAASGASNCASPTITLEYDPLGRLRQTVASSVTTQFVYDGDALVMEYDGSNAIQRRYVHGAGVDEPVVWYEGANLSTRRTLVSDRQGSIIAAADSSGALVGNRYRYGPYGEPDAWAGARFRYTGQIALPEAQLYHYKARVYDPVLGRFLQTDPVGYQDDFNLYLYVRNDPLNLIDRTGRLPGDLFPDIRSAAADAIQFINPTSIAQNTEHIGGVYRNADGMFYASNPAQGGATGASTSLSPTNLVGYYHTHGNYSKEVSPGNVVATTQAEDQYTSDQFSAPVVGAPAGSPPDDFALAAQYASSTGNPDFRSFLGTPSGNMLEMVGATGTVTPLVGPFAAGTAPEAPAAELVEVRPPPALELN